MSNRVKIRVGRRRVERRIYHRTRLSIAGSPNEGLLIQLGHAFVSGFEVGVCQYCHREHVVVRSKAAGDGIWTAIGQLADNDRDRDSGARRVTSQIW